MDSKKKIEKQYETIAWEKMSGIDEYKRALDEVLKFIISKRLVLYGGMAIDLSLKSQGHEGIYPDNILPDYDFYSSNILTDIEKLATILIHKGFENVKVFNGLHVCTRKLNINIHYSVADLSYYPTIYFKQIPLWGKKLKYVSPNFQRLDIHRSLSYLYENAPRDNYRHRLKKDLERLELLNKFLPFNPEKIKKPIKGKYCINYLDDKVLEYEIKFKNFCISGMQAYTIYYNFIKEKYPNFLKNLSPPLENKTPEIFIDEYPELEGIFFEKTCDILPQAFYHENVMYFINYGQRISTCLINEQEVVCINYLCCLFLFKYYMKGICAEYYKSCLAIFLFLLESEPLMAISARAFGSFNLSDRVIYDEKIDECLFVGVKNYEPYPKTYAKSQGYDVYKITGKIVDNLNKKSLSCDIEIPYEKK